MSKIKSKNDPRKKPLWSPDKNNEFHLGDLMYNIEKCKELNRKDKKKNAKMSKRPKTSI